MLRSGIARGTSWPAGLDDETQADGEVDALLQRPPCSEQRLVDAQRRASDASPTRPVTGPPAEDSQRVEGVDALHLKPGGLGDGAQPLAGVAAVMPEAGVQWPVPGGGGRRRGPYNRPPGRTAPPPPPPPPASSAVGATRSCEREGG